MDHCVLVFIITGMIHAQKSTRSVKAQSVELHRPIEKNPYVSGPRKFKPACSRVTCVPLYPLQMALSTFAVSCAITTI